MTTLTVEQIHKINHIEQLKNQYKDYPIKWGWNGLGYLIYKRTYARDLWKVKRKQEWTDWIYTDELTNSEYKNHKKMLAAGTMLHRKEEFHETIARCLKGLIEIGVNHTLQDLSDLFAFYINLKGLGGGRHLWQLGTKTVQKVGMDSLNNCWAWPIDSFHSFIKTFDELMLGGGVGFSVENEYISKLPAIKNKVKVSHNSKKLNKKDFTKQEKEFGKIYNSVFGKDIFIGDSREGWLTAVEVLFNKFIKDDDVENNNILTFYYNLIRKKGSLIKSFGGKASGYKPLMMALTKIAEILNNAVGRQLNSEEVLDIVCILADCVVSGNVRRSALLAVGDENDERFLTYKRWDLKHIPAHRNRVNLTINCTDIKNLHPLFKESFEKLGESIGLMNRKNTVAFNRINEHFEDNDSIIPNPCAEFLGSQESCNLAEIFLSNIDSYEEFVKFIKLQYKNNKQICLGNYIYPEVNEKIHNNLKIGIGITGIMQCTDKLSWLSPAYNELREFDKEYSKMLGCNESKKLTVIKPSGTLSLLAGTTAGVHPEYAPFYYRTVRFSANDDLWKLCEKHGFKVEDSITRTSTDENGNAIFETDPNVKVVYFPIKASNNSIVRKDISPKKQMEYVKFLQENWADQSVSVTVYFDKDNLNELWTNLENDWDSLKTISFLQDQHGFLQAPLIEITEKEYNDAIAKVIPINSVESFIDQDIELADSVECEGGVCPVK